MKNIFWIMVVLFISGCSKSLDYQEATSITTAVTPKNELVSTPRFIIEEIPIGIQEEMMGRSMQENAIITYDQLRLVHVTYVNFKGKTQYGEVVVHKKLADEVRAIFKELYDAKYPIAMIKRIDAFGGDDQTSMLANNSSAFCYRTIANSTVLSNHGKGMAIDINPFQNPHVVKGIANPKEAAAYVDRRNNQKGMIVKGDACYKAFTKRGWTWGGDWRNPDYQHFEKKVPL